MALSGIETTEVGPYNELVLKWTATQSVANNTSTITAILYWGASRSGVGWVTSSNTRECVVAIAGTTSTLYVNPTLSAGQVKEVNRLVKTVSHGTDGRLSQWLYSRYDIQVTLNGTYYSSVRADTLANLNSIQTNIVKAWNGSAWVTGVPKVWTGSAWATAKAVKVWTDGGWSN